MNKIPLLMIIKKILMISHIIDVYFKEKDFNYHIDYLEILLI
ncbi:MAG: hypothetical protein ACLUIS_06955 [Longibaculum sp.]